MKNKLLAAILTGALCLGLCACGGREVKGPNKTPAASGIDSGVTNQASKVEPINLGIFNESVSISDSESYRSMVTYSRYAPRLFDENESVYANLARTFESVKAESEGQKEEDLKQLLGYYEDYYEGRQIDEEYPVYMSMESEGEVLRADTALVSIWSHYYDYTGGAHGNYMYNGRNFDTESGKELKLSDIVLDEDRFFELVDEGLKSGYGDIYQDLRPLNEYRSNLKEYGLELCFAVDNQGVIAIFNPYDLGVYAMGAQFVRVPFKAAPEIFAPKYQETADRYISNYIQSLSEVGYDVNGDGRSERIFVDANADEYGTIENIELYCGDKTASVETFCYDTESYIVYQDGKYFVWVLANVEGYTSWNIFDLETMEVTTVEGFNADRALYSSDYTYEEAEAGLTRSSSKIETYTLSDPAYMILRPSIELLGNNWSAKGEFAFTTKPVGIENIGGFYTISSTGVIRANRDVAAALYDSDGLKEGEAIPAGTYLTMIATDGETWADLQVVPESLINFIEDSEYMYMDKPWVSNPNTLIYRVYVEDSGEWYRMVNGENEMEVFSGVIYAG